MLSTGGSSNKCRPTIEAPAHAEDGLYFPDRDKITHKSEGSEQSCDARNVDG